jgi:hypothetical protein
MQAPDPLVELEALLGIAYTAKERQTLLLEFRIGHLMERVIFLQAELRDARAHLSLYRAKDEYARQHPQIHIGAFKHWWFWHNPIDWVRGLFSQ